MEKRFTPHRPRKRFTSIVRFVFQYRLKKSYESVNTHSNMNRHRKRRSQVEDSGKRSNHVHGACFERSASFSSDRQWGDTCMGFTGYGSASTIQRPSMWSIRDSFLIGRIRSESHCEWFRRFSNLYMVSPNRWTSTSSRRTQRLCKFHRVVSETSLSVGKCKWRSHGASVELIFVCVYVFFLLLWMNLSLCMR